MLSQPFAAVAFLLGASAPGARAPCPVLLPDPRV